jgi:type VI secretion system protein ImpJ|tara:strand:+ start:1565 stop:2932 length:1368 start_codon:yes stop_codon:yes gene_type:complete
VLNLPKIKYRVHWNEGLLLSSQHFQHTDHCFESLLAHQLKRVSRFYWGVNRLQIDEVALASNELVLTAFEGVFPDGSVVQFGGADESYDGSWRDQSVGIKLDDLGIQVGAVVTVSVSLAKYNSQCASDTDGDRKRYSSVNEGAIPDIGDSQNEVDLVTLQPLLRLSIAGERSPNHSSLPIAKVQKTEDGSYQLIAFTPPQLSASLGYTEKRDDLWEQLSSLVVKARSKAVQLRSVIVDRRSEQVVTQLQRSRIIALTHLLPALETLLGAKAHPFDVFCKVIDYASDLAALRDDPVPPAFAKYVHNELNETFKPVFAFIGEVIESVRLDYSVLQFELNDDGNHVCQLPDALPGETILLAFQLPLSADKETLIDWVENAYICNEGDYEQLSLKRDIGFERTHVQRFEKFKLVEGNNEVLFEVRSGQASVSALLVSGSDKELDAAKPDVILCFREQLI